MGIDKWEFHLTCFVIEQSLSELCCETERPELFLFFSSFVVCLGHVYDVVVEWTKLLQLDMQRRWIFSFMDDIGGNCWSKSNMNMIIIVHA